MLKKYFFTLLFLGWLVFITLLSLFSFKEEQLPSLGIPFADKWVHFSFYFGFVFIGSLSFREQNHKNKPLKKLLPRIILCAILYGILIEALQGVATVDRDPDVLDALANSAGALLGGLVVKFIFSGKTSLKWLK